MKIYFYFYFFSPPTRASGNPEVLTKHFEDHCIYGHLIYKKEVRIYNVVKTDYLINGVGETGQIHGKNWN